MESNESDLNALNSISSKVKEKDERIWTNEAHTEAIKRETEKLDEEIKVFAFRARELDENNEEFKNQLQLVESITMVLQKTLKLPHDSLILLNELKILRAEKTERDREKYASALAQCRSKFDGHKARYELTNMMYKQLNDISVKEKKIRINILDLKQKYKDHCSIKSQYRKMKIMLFYRDVLGFSHSSLVHYKTKNAFRELKQADVKEKVLVRKSLDLQKEVKERRNRAIRMINVATTVPKIDFSMNSQFTGVAEDWFSANSERRQGVPEDIQQQKAMFSMLAPAFSLPEIDTPRFSTDLSQKQMASTQDEFHIPNPSEDHSQPHAIKTVKFSEDNTKVRILEVIDLPIKKNHPSKVDEKLIAAKISQAAKKIAEKKYMRKTSSVYSIQNYSQKSQLGKQKEQSDMQKLSQGSLTSVSGSKIQALGNLGPSQSTQIKTASPQIVNGQEEDKNANGCLQNKETKVANIALKTFSQDNRNKIRLGSFPKQSNVESISQSSDLKFFTPPFEFSQKTQPDGSQNSDTKAGNSQMPVSILKVKRDNPAQAKATFAESTVISQTTDDIQAGGRDRQSSRFFNELPVFLKANQESGAGSSLQRRQKENIGQDRIDVHFEAQGELTEMDSYADDNTGDQPNFSLACDEDQPNQSLDLSFETPVMSPENNFVSQQPTVGFGNPERNAERGPKKEGISFVKSKFSLF